MFLGHIDTLRELIVGVGCGWGGIDGCWKVWMKYTEVDTSLFAAINLINFVADIKWLLGGFISYLKGDGQPTYTVEFRTSNSRNLFITWYLLKVTSTKKIFFAIK